MGGTLWLVAAPIGNLGDLSTRAREVLDQVDLIACEDHGAPVVCSRGSGSRPARVVLRGQQRERVDGLLARLGNGDDVALVSDEGDAAVSDPGYHRLVRACIDAGVGAGGARTVGGDRRARRLGPADRPVRLRGVPAQEARRAGAPPRRCGTSRVVVFESPLRVPTLLRDVLVAIRRSGGCGGAGNPASCTRRSCAVA